MNLKLRKYVKRQPKEDKEFAAQILNTTSKLLKEGKSDQAIKFLMHNKMKLEQKRKTSFLGGLFKKILN